MTARGRAPESRQGAFRSHRRTCFRPPPWRRSSNRRHQRSSRTRGRIVPLHGFPPGIGNTSCLAGSLHLRAPGRFAARDEWAKGSRRLSRGQGKDWNAALTAGPPPAAAFREPAGWTPTVARPGGATRQRTTSCGSRVTGRGSRRLPWTAISDFTAWLALQAQNPCRLVTGWMSGWPPRMRSSVRVSTCRSLSNPPWAACSLVSPSKTEWSL